MKLPEQKILWRDRKRILGMPITFTKYALSEDRLFRETGLLTSRQEEIVLYRIRDIGLQISLGQRLFGVGTVLVHSSDQTAPHLEIKNVKDPNRVKELLHQQVEEMKIRRRVRLGEWMSDDGDGCEDCGDGEE